MAEPRPDQPNSDASIASRRAVPAPPPVARSARRTNREQVITTTVSADPFAVPSEPPVNNQPEPISGPEPAIFGGVNPAPAPVSPMLPPTPPEPDSEVDEVTAGPVVPPTIRNLFASIRESNRLLGVILALLLTIGSLITIEMIPAESYVHVTIHMTSPELPDPERTTEQHADINQLFRSYPLRAAARKILAEKHPGLAPGFLESMMFTNPNAIVWSDPLTVTLRATTTEPAEDSLRLAAAAEAFFEIAKVRDHAYQQQLARIENYRTHLRELQRQKEELESDIARASSNGNAANGAADTSLAEVLEQRILSTEQDIAREQRILDTWITPQKIDSAGVQNYDSRPLRHTALAILWGTLLVLFGIPMAMNFRNRRGGRQRAGRSRHVVRRLSTP